MAKKQKKNKVVRIERSEDEPPPTPQHLTAPVRPGEVFRDPETGQYMRIIPADQPDMTTRRSSQSRLLPHGVDAKTGGIGFEGRIEIVQFPDGSESSVIDGRLQSVRHTPAPSAAGGVDDGIPQAMSKKRVFIGIVLSVLVLMVLADVVGVPHVRTEPGEYASLEGTKTISNNDAPLVILKRLDRSVFLYMFDGIGWVYNALGGGDRQEP